ncbi:unnamed protein product, partial [Adineta steineri]
MFKNLKEKLATQVTKTNQPFLSSIPSPDSTSKSKDSGTRTSSITSRDDNHETNRSRLDSASSDISQFSVGHSPNYVSPPRTYRPPSDIESEYGGEESDHEGNTTSKSKDSGTRTSSITSRDDNLETNRSRLDSASSDISQFSVGHSPNYVSPPRTYRPPSDIE